MWQILSSLGGGIVNGVTGYFTKKQEIKGRQLELDQVIHLQKIEYVKAGRIAEVEWNKASINKAGWRPGYLTILLTLPLILVFFPPMIPYIDSGFAALEKAPVWYTSGVAVVISSAFGYKKFADWQMSKHYTMPDPMDKVKTGN